MSATLRVTDFTLNKTLFLTPPPVVNISARQHPVTVHFNRKTTSSYVTETVSKAVKIHARLPAGGILIFLTGQDEISSVCKKLEARFGAKALDERNKRRKAASKTAEVPDIRKAILERTQKLSTPLAGTSTQVSYQTYHMLASIMILISL